MYMYQIELNDNNDFITLLERLCGNSQNLLLVNKNVVRDPNYTTLLSPQPLTHRLPARDLKKKK